MLTVRITRTCHDKSRPVKTLITHICEEITVKKKKKNSYMDKRLVFHYTFTPCRTKKIKEKKKANSNKEKIKKGKKLLFSSMP